MVEVADGGVTRRDQNDGQDFGRVPRRAEPESDDRRRAHPHRGWGIRGPEEQGADNQDRRRLGDPSHDEALGDDAHEDGTDLMTLKKIRPPKKGKQPRASTKQQRGGRR